MERSKIKKIRTNNVLSFKDLKNCYLCNTINLSHEHNNIILPLLKTISQWETERSSQIISIQYQCIVCNYKSKCFQKWKMHVMSKSHISTCHNLKKLCSYFCKACNTLIYGSEKFLNRHKNKKHGDKNNLSSISILMSELLNCLDSHSIHIYFCSKCKIISEKPIHTSGDHLKNQILYDCKYCNTTFLCNNIELDFHEASVEHLIFKCIYSIKKAIEANSLKLQIQDKITKPTRDLCKRQIKLLNLPLIILDRFQKTSESIVKCNFCDVNVRWNTQKIVKHINVCTNKGDLTSEIHEMLLTAYDCKVCNFYTNSFFNYKLHVISPKHLTNCHANGDFYSYFCTICNLYIYGSKIQINDHLEKKHKTKLIDLPFLSKVLKDNYKHTSNHPGSDFIDYYSDQQSYEKDFFPVQCNACKISFCMSNNDYKLHEISSEHVILKYFTSKNPVVMKHNFKYEHLQTTSTTNANLIINKEVLNNKCSSSTKTDNSNLEELSVNKGCSTTINRKVSVSSTILKNNKQLKNCNENKSHSAISSSNTDHNIQQNMYNKLENKAISQELFSKNTKNIDYTMKQKNIQPTEESQSNIKTPYMQLHSTDTDQAYGHYVTERLKNVQNLSIKNNIKIEIDALFCMYT